MYVMKNLFKTKFDVAVIVLIPACIGINYLGKLFASVLKLPLWLDSIGTCIGGCLGGPIIGAICGAANNLIYGFSAGDNITLIYALTSLGIGAAAGIMARLGFMKSFPKAIITACVAGFVAVAISTPLNVLFRGRNAFPRVLKFPSVSSPRLRWASMIVFIVPIICGMIWNTEVTM